MKKISPVVLLVALAALLATAAVASAAEFKATVSPVHFTFSGGVGHLVTTGGNNIECKKNHGEGEVTPPAEVGKVFVTYEECKGVAGLVEGYNCGTINTDEIQGSPGDLGGANKGPSGVLLAPASGTTFATFTCSGLFSAEVIVTGEVEGKMQGACVNKLARRCELVFARTGGVQNYKTFNGTGSHHLTADIPLLGSEEEAAIEGTDTLETVASGEEIEITEP